MAEAPVISVIVPAYGRSERLSVLVGQLLSQAPDTRSYEIIVVDDGSPEPVAPSLAGVIEGAACPVRCLRKENGGPAAARSFGAAASAATYLLFVDDDMCVGPGFIRGHLDTHARYQPAAVNGQFLWKIDAEPGRFTDWYRRRTEHWVAERVKSMQPLDEDTFAIPGVLLTTANLSIRREDFERLGGFDAGFLFGCEDQDFGVRVERSGIRTLSTSRAEAVHVETHNTLRRVCLRQQKGVIDVVRFERRYLDRPEESGIAREYGPLSASDPWRLTVKKLFRALLTRGPVAGMAFSAVAALEKVSPASSLLPRCYDVLISAYTQRGWREGLRVHADRLAPPPGSLLPDR